MHILKISKFHTITPSEEMPLTTFNSIANCWTSEGHFWPCRIAAAGTGWEEFPDDHELQVTMAALEMFALDTTKDPNAKCAARLAQFRLSEMDCIANFREMDWLCRICTAALDSALRTGTVVPQFAVTMDSILSEIRRWTGKACFPTG